MDKLITWKGSTYVLPPKRRECVPTRELTYNSDNSMPLNCPHQYRVGRQALQITGVVGNECPVMLSRPPMAESHDEEN